MRWSRGLWVYKIGATEVPASPEASYGSNGVACKRLLQCQILAEESPWYACQKAHAQYSML